MRKNRFKQIKDEMLKQYANGGNLNPIWGTDLLSSGFQNPVVNGTTINFRNTPVNNVPPTTEPVLGNYVNPNFNEGQYLAEQGQQMTNSSLPAIPDMPNNNTPQYTTNQPYQFYNPYGGVDIPTSAFTLGASIQEGNTLGTIASSAKLGLGLARNVLSGIGLAKVNQNTMQDYRQNQRDYMTYANRTGYYAEGGNVSEQDKLAMALTGNYMFDMSQGMPYNVEIEDGEMVKHGDTGEVQQAVGEKHDQGGIKTQLSDNTKILSDKLKIGGKKAQRFRKEFDIKVKATTTYAEALEKYSKKIGLDELIDEQEDLIETMQKQQKEVTDEDTLGLNMQYASNRINEIEKEKAPLEKQRQEVFDQIYKDQEKAKPKSERDNTVFENGGTVTATSNIKMLADKYRIPYDRAEQLVKEYATGGNVQDPPPSGRVYQNPYNTGNFNRQRFTDGTTLSGAVTPNNVLERIQAQYTQMPYLIQRSGLGVVPDTSNIPDLLVDPNLNVTSANPSADAIGQFQVGYNEYLTAAENAALSNPYLSQEAKNQYIEQIRTQRFGDQTARNFDRIYGDFTSSRPGVGLPALTAADRAAYGDSIQRIGDVVNADGTLKPGFEKLDPQTVSYLQDVVKSEGQRAFDINLLDVPAATTSPTFVDTPDNTQTQDTTVNQTVDTVNNMGAYLMPDQNPLPPPALMAALKVNRRFDRIDPALISTEQNIEEIRRQENAALDQINTLPDSQRIAALSNLNVNSQNNLNKVISDTNRLNSQILNQAQSQNAEIQRMEENAAAQDALSYEQRQLRALALTQNDFNNYYNTLQANNVRNFRTINDLNLLNSMYPDFQLTQDGIQKTTPNVVFSATPIAPKSENKTNTRKKSRGGRFKK